MFQAFRLLKKKGWNNKGTFSFKIFHTFCIGTRLGLQTGLSDTHTLFFSSAFVMCAECGFCTVILNAWTFLERMWP